MLTQEKSQKYCLSPSVRVLAEESNVIRLRWGIWNFEEVTIDLRNESKVMQKATQNFFEQLTSLTEADGSFTRFSELNSLEKANLQLTLQQLTEKGFITNNQKNFDGNNMARVVLGNLSFYETQKLSRTAVAFTSDSDYANKYLEQQNIELNMEIKILPQEFFHKISHCDLTMGINLLENKNIIFELEQYLVDCQALAANIRHSSILAMRNLNRLAMFLEIPLILGLVDGPFTTVVGCESPQTGCLECFEQYSLARLEDHVSYHDFLNTNFKENYPAKNKGNPVEAMMCSLLVNEAIVLKNFGTSRFIGRALSVYLPSYEMQTQDVVRIVTCPACGQAAKNIAAEINFNTRSIIDKYIEDSVGER